MKRLTITGNVGQNPEFKYAPDGKEYGEFSVGVSVGNKQNPKTDWIKIKCTGKINDIIRSYVKKGSKLLVEGFPTVNAYINREGKAIGTIQLFANTLELLSTKENSSQFANHNESLLESEDSNVELAGDDVPF